MHGKTAEWSKALVLGTSHFGGAGSNPVPVIIRLGIIKRQIPYNCHNPNPNPNRSVTSSP